MVHASPALAKADYTSFDKFLEGSLVKRCGTDAICIRWIVGEQLKHYSTHGNLRCVGPNYLFEFKLLPAATKDDRSSSYEIMQFHIYM